MRPSTTDPLTARHLDLLRQMAQLDPPPALFGGYAEDALLAGTVTRPHLDIDWLVPRIELAQRLNQAQTLGFSEFETWGESGPGEPFYLCGRNGELSIDIGISDDIDGRILGRIWKLAFEVDGQPAPAGYQFEMPQDTYRYPPSRIDGIALRAVSPLALYQLRAAIATQGSFGPLSETQQNGLRKLRETFFPTKTENELAPRIETLPRVPGI
jgi:hypothetical protein